MARANVEVREWDMSTIVPSFPGVYGAIVVPSMRGEVNKPVLVTSEAQFLKKITPDETVKIGYDGSHFSAIAYLIKSNKLWVVRAANNPIYGGAVFSQDLPVTQVSMSVNVGSNTLTASTVLSTQKEVADALFAFISPGEKVSVSSSGDMPLGINAGQTYYAIVTDPEKYTIQLAESLSDADDGIPVSISNAGSGIITLSILGSNSNASISLGVSNPEGFVMDSSDGRIAGLESTFTVDVNRDAFQVDQLFYDMAATGDRITLSASTFPVADTGDPLFGDIIYYVIKNPDDREIMLARSLTDAMSEILIPVSTAGSDVTGLLIDKLSSSPATANPAQNSFSVSSQFYAACENGDAILIDSSSSDFPTVDAGDPFENGISYYIIKGATNEVQLSRSSEEPFEVATFLTAGSGLTLSLQDKESTSSLTADLSNDSLSVSPTFYENIRSGDMVYVSSSNNLPGGINADTPYYVIKTPIENTIKMAQSPEAVVVEQVIDITSEGTGTHSILNASNSELIGTERYCLFFYGADPGKWNNSIYIKTIHYPIGDKSTWGAEEIAAADTVKEEDCFLVYVYMKNPDGSVTLAEGPHLCSRYKNKKDGYNNNVYVEDVLKASSYIRVIDNGAVDESIYPSNQDQILMLYGGDDGGQVTDSHMLVALDSLKNRRNIPITLLLDGGWSTPAYQKQGLLSIAAGRGDCFSILSMPVAKEKSSNYMDAIVNYRKNELNAASSWGGLYTPHLLIQDKYNNRQVYVPPDGYVAAAISETAANYELWYPPAGPRRGILKVLDTMRRYTEGEMDDCYDNDINPIDFYPGRGIRIWGQKTLQGRPSTLDRVNARLALIVIEPAIAAYLEDFLFEFNDAATRASVDSGIRSYMQNIKSRRGCYDFEVVCSEENNTPEDIDNLRMNVWVFVSLTKAAEFIRFTTIITRANASYSIV
jgi:hypothetical protein